jgi:protein-disulfide isomerase
VAKSTRSASASSSNRRYILIGAVALVLVAGYVLLSGRQGDTVTAPVELTGEMANLQGAKGVPLGDAGAPVMMMEFADFQCPACADFTTFIHPLIKERLIDQGIAQMVRYDFPIVSGHPYAFLAARASRCAEEHGKFWEYHDVVYGQQQSWSMQGNSPVEEFEDYAERVGIDPGDFSSCLRSDRHAAEVTRNLRLGESMGVQGTPTIMINGQMINPANYTELEAIVMQAAGRTTPVDSMAPVDSAAGANPG